MMKKQVKLAVVACAAGLMSIPIANADGYYYAGEEGGDFAADASWTYGAYPTNNWLALNNTAYLDSVITNQNWALLVGNSGTGVLNIQPGGEVSYISSTPWNSQIGTGTDSSGTINQSGGAISFNELELGRSSGATGDYNLSGGTLTIVNALASASLHLGSSKSAASDFGVGTMTITGGELITKNAVQLGHSSYEGTGIFDVQGTGSTNISIGGYTDGTGGWTQYDGSSLKLGMAAEGVSTINIVNGSASFSYESLLEPYFLDGVDASSMEGTTWTVMTASGTISDNGMKFADNVDISLWNFGVTNGNTLWVSYGLGGWSDAVPPAMPENLYAVISNRSVTVKWDTAGGADSYNVKRSQDSGSNYVTLVSGVTNLYYTDATVEVDETYYYVVSSSNAYGESGNSTEISGIGFPYDILGTDSSYGAGSSLDKDNLFDGDITSFYDTTTSGSWVGLDFGEGNAQQIFQIDYVLRDWSWRAPAYATNCTFEGANDETFADAVILYTVPTNVVANPTVNTAIITNTTPFRYVRLSVGTSGRPLYSFAEVDFVIGDDFTANGTLKSWLKGYGLTEADDTLDADNDGLLCWEEYVAGTVPTNGASLLEVNSVEVTTNGVVVAWQSVEGKSYTLYGDSTLGGLDAADVITNVTGLATETSYTITGSASDTAFYKISVE
jgi:hypothetical protein